MRLPAGRVSWLGISTANLTTTVLFAFAHVLRAPLFAAAVVPPSLVLGWLRERTGSVIPCIFVHSTYNTGWLLLLNCNH